MANKNLASEKEAFWRLALEEFHESGLTVRAYCLQEGLSEPSFYAWRRSIKKRNAAEADAPGDEQALVPVEVVGPLESDSAAWDQASRSRPLEVVTPSGFTLRFHPDIEPRQLDAVLGVIADCHGATPC